MRNTNHRRWLQIRLARATHRAAMRLVPRHVREQHGADMIATFAQVVDSAAGRGRWAILGALGNEVKDLLQSRGTDRAPHPRQLSAGIGAACGINREAPAMTDVLRQLLSLRHLVQAARSLARRPAFALAALFTLAFSTAAVTTLFGVVNTVLLRPLPYPDADRLVTIQETNSSKRGQVSLVAPVRLDDWSRLSQTFTTISGSYAENVTDTSGADPERLDARRVMPRFFTVYGAAPIAGRTPTADEDKFGGPRVAVISEGFWNRRFNRSADAIGSGLTIGGAGFTIVGVMPRSFTSASTDLWLPAQLSPGPAETRESRFLSGVGRLRPGVTIEQAHADLVRVQKALGEQFPKSDKDWSVAISDLKGARVSAQQQTLWLVFGAVALLWLIGVTNIAGLMLVQIHRRAREVAIRTAIGASRGQLIGLVVSESIVLACAGAIAGVGLAALAIEPIRATFTALPRLNELGADWRVIAFAAGTSLLSTVLFGLWPALYATRGRAALTMAMGSRGSSSARHRLQTTLVIAQVALSVTLVASAALLVRSYVNLSNLDFGFGSDNVLTFHVGARWDEDRNPIGVLQVRLIEGLQHSPGVEAAGFANFLPLMNATLRYQVKVAGLAGPETNGTMSVGSRMVNGSYFQALRVPLVAGAWCPSIRVDPKMTSSVIVNRRFVDEFAQGQNVVGRGLEYAQYPGSALPIVGVVADLAEDSPGAAPMPYVYTCDAAGSWPDPEYVVRTRDPRGTASAIRQIVKSLDPSRAVFGLRPLSEVSDSALDQPRLNAGMLGLFAGAAMMLAAIGLYSLFMLLVGESTREIGVRLALGAAPAQMTRRVLLNAMKLLAVGIAIGLALSAAASHLLSTLLFGVTPLDPATLGAATLLLAAISVLAIVVPAIRAGRVDPIVAMRTD